MARMVAIRQQIAEHRKAIRKQARERLDATAHAIDTSAKALEADPNVLTYRYHRTRLTEAARLRALEGRGEPEGDDAAE